MKTNVLPKDAITLEEAKKWIACKSPQKLDIL